MMWQIYCDYSGSGLLTVIMASDFW